MVSNGLGKTPTVTSTLNPHPVLLPARERAARAERGQVRVMFVVNPIEICSRQALCWVNPYVEPIAASR
jgi:hypothetical protein